MNDNLTQQLHWDAIRPVLLQAFAKHGARDFWDQQWIRLIQEDFVAYFRAIQRHSGGILIDPELMGYILIPHNWKEYFYHTGSSFSIQSILENGLIPGGKESHRGDQTVFFTPLNPLVEILKKKSPVMITQFLKKCTSTVIGNIIKMPFIWKIIQSTRSRIAILANEVTCNHLERSCASRVHLQSNLSERRSNTVRKTLNPTTRAKSHTDKQLAIAAAAAVYLWWCVDEYKETCTGEPIWDKRRQRRHNGWSDLYKETCTGEPIWDKRRQRRHNGRSDLYKETCTGSWASCWEKATIRNWSSSRRGISRRYLARWSEDKWDHRKIGKV